MYSEQYTVAHCLEIVRNGVTSAVYLDNCFEQILKLMRKVIKKLHGLCLKAFF